MKILCQNGTKLCEAVNKTALYAQSYTVGGRKTAINVCKHTQFCQLKGISIWYTDEECQDVRHATATICTLIAIPDHHLLTLLKDIE